MMDVISLKYYFQLLVSNYLWSNFNIYLVQWSLIRYSWHGYWHRLYLWANEFLCAITCPFPGGTLSLIYHLLRFCCLWYSTCRFQASVGWHRFHKVGILHFVCLCFPYFPYRLMIICFVPVAWYSCFSFNICFVLDMHWIFSLTSLNCSATF